MSAQVKRTSILTGKVHTLILPTTPEKIAQWDHWNRSPEAPLIQDYFPELSAAEREFVNTGCTDDEWEAAFGEDDIVAPGEEI